MKEKEILKREEAVGQKIISARRGVIRSGRLVIMHLVVRRAAWCVVCLSKWGGFLLSWVLEGKTGLGVRPLEGSFWEVLANGQGITDQEVGSRRCSDFHVRMGRCDSAEGGDTGRMLACAEPLKWITKE